MRKKYQWIIYVNLGIYDVNSWHSYELWNFGGGKGEEIEDIIFYILYSQ